jgi:hypothetical protein
MNTIKYGIYSTSTVLKGSDDIHNSRINKLLLYLLFCTLDFLPEAKPITREVFIEKRKVKRVA